MERCDIKAHIESLGQKQLAELCLEMMENCYVALTPVKSRELSTKPWFKDEAIVNSDGMYLVPKFRMVKRNQTVSVFKKGFRKKTNPNWEYKPARVNNQRSVNHLSDF